MLLHFRHSGHPWPLALFAGNGLSPWQEEQAFRVLLTALTYVHVGNAADGRFGRALRGLQRFPISALASLDGQPARTLSPWMACMQVLQEQKPVIAMDGVYAGFAGAKTCRKAALTSESAEGQR